MKPKICASLTGRSFRELKELTNLANRNLADFIEIRFDYLTENLDASEIRNLSKKPLIATNRPVREGGLSKAPEVARINSLILASKRGFNYIDIELHTPNLQKIIKQLKKEKCKVIVSYHNYKETPSIQYLHEIMKKEITIGADICKVISTAKNIEDNITPLNLITQTFSKKRNIIAFCMGNQGQLSRLLSPFIGGAFTYASVKRGKEAAPGQVSLTIMKQIYALMNL